MTQPSRCAAASHRHGDRLAAAGLIPSTSQPECPRLRVGVSNRDRDRRSRSRSRSRSDSDSESDSERTPGPVRVSQPDSEARPGAPTGFRLSPGLSHGRRSPGPSRGRGRLAGPGAAGCPRATASARTGGECGRHWRSLESVTPPPAWPGPGSSHSTAQGRALLESIMIVTIDLVRPGRAGPGPPAGPPAAALVTVPSILVP
jgi:hypothetical protein